MINLVESAQKLAITKAREAAELKLPPLPKPDEITWFEHGEPCKHMEAVFSIVRAAKLALEVDHPEGGPSLRCVQCCTWDVRAGFWRGLEADWPSDLLS